MKYLIIGLLSVIAISIFQPVTDIPQSEPVQAAQIETLERTEQQDTMITTPEPAKVAPTSSIDAKNYIYSHESGGCVTKWEGEYGDCPAYHGTPTSPNVGYGLCQSTPAWKMESAGPDWATSYETQDKWCTQYAQDRYSGWDNAYQTWINQRWW